jgi:outer membrane protein OmpA-like peptidoglycan-associated protein
LGDVFGIYCARRTKDGWSEPQRLKLPSGLEADNLFSPTISSNNRTIFVLRSKPAEAKKKEPCKELLLFEKNKEGEWIGPKYLPKEFNTGCQETPFISADNNSLYFSSKRIDIDKNTGKKIADDDSYNIYFARRIDENNWYYPVYVAAVNTEFDNLSPMVNSASDYFICNTKTGKKQATKIFTLPLPADKKPAQTFVVKGSITDLYSKEPVEAGISVQNAITSVLQGDFETDYAGKYSIILTQGTFYKLDFSNAGYSHTYYYKDLNFSEKSKEQTFDLALYNNVTLELNIYDNELFYPVSPTVTIVDSLTRQAVATDRIVNVSKGKYNCKLNIGNIYKIAIQSDDFEPYEIYFDLRTDVLYSNFEKSLELKAARKILDLNVTDNEGANILPVNIDVKNLNRDENAASIVKYDNSGKPSLSLRTNNRYELNITKKGYTYYNTTLDIQTTVRENLDVKLEQLTTQTKMVFNNITFETNSAELNAESYAELNRLVEFMKNNPELKIEISAHTDDVGSDAYNIRLSDKRAESVVKFLMSNEIGKNHLQSKGYGKSQPLVPNNSDENRAKNRRVEIKIIENTTN